MESMAKTWFITGCSSGFGNEISKRVIEEGDNLIATSRHIDNLKEWEINYPARVKVIALDIESAEQVKEAFRQSVEKFASIDVVVNNAGYGLVGAIEEVTDKEMRAIFDTNVFGLLNVTREALPYLRHQRKGHIINFSSVAGMRASAGLGGYSATKFAVEGISEALAEELKALNIHVTIIEPGGFRTNWGGKSMAFASNSISDYNTVTSGVRNFFQSVMMPNVAPGDPVKLAKAIFNLSNEKNPPLRLALGSDSYLGIKDKLENVEKELERWKAVTLTTGFNK
jgi:short-subunit dehydrogenase